MEPAGHVSLCFDQSEMIFFAGYFSFSAQFSDFRRQSAVEVALSYLDKLGVEFRPNTEIGRDFSMEQLLREYDSVVWYPSTSIRAVWTGALRIGMPGALILPLIF